MIGGTQKQLTNFAVVVSDEETECVNHIWFALLIGERQIDGKEVIELRTWKGGMLQDVVTAFFDRRLRENPLEADFERLKTMQENAKLEAWIDEHAPRMIVQRNRRNGVKTMRRRWVGTCLVCRREANTVVKNESGAMEELCRAHYIEWCEAWRIAEVANEEDDVPF